MFFFFFIGSEPGGRIGSVRFDSIRFGLVWFGLAWSVSVSVPVSAVPLVTSLGRLASRLPPPTTTTNLPPIPDPTAMHGMQCVSVMKVATLVVEVGLVLLTS